MIFGIATEICETLDDAVQAKQKGTLPSLEDERANAEQASVLLAQQAEEAEAQRALEDREEEDRMLQQMVKEEVHRRDRKTKRTIDPSTSSNGQSESIKFDQLATLDSGSARFSEVQLLTQLPASSTSRNNISFLARPICSPPASAMVVVRRRKVEKSRDDILEVEKLLEKSRKLHRHPGILAILAFRIDKLGFQKSEIVICQEYADRGTLHDLLELCVFNV
jgi:eukaryotic translation initiation factor 2-alpha kinase 4